jgi:hypothetical protein
MPENDDLEFRGNPRNIQYTTKVARILNQTETGVARARSEEAENFLERQYGRLFIALDLDFTSDFYDIGEVLVDTMEREFYSDLNRGVEASFEGALTAVNQTLADLAAEGQSEWVGKLNAVIVALHDNQVYVTKVGAADAYLVRGHSATNITEGLTDSEGGQTAKTFLNVASGSLEVGDKLVVATGEFYEHLSTQDLRRVLYLHAPTKAVQKFGEALSGKSPAEFSAVVVELTTIDLVSAETVTDDPDELILSAPRKHFEKLQKFKPFKEDTPIAEYSEKAKKHWNKRVKPGLDRGIGQVRHRVRTWNATRKGEAPPPPPPRPAAGTPQQAERRHRTPGKSSVGTSGSSDDLSGGAGRSAKRHLDRAGRGAASALKPASQKAGELWRRSGIPKTTAWRTIARHTTPLTERVRKLPIREQLAGNRRVLYRNLILAVVGILLISLALSINAAQTKKAEDKIRTRIDKVEEIQAKAEASYIFKDLPGARSQLAEAVKQANDLEKEKLLTSDVAALQQSLRVSYDRINNVVVVPNQPLVDFSKQAGKSTLTSLAESGTTLYAMPESGAMQTFNQADKQIKSAQTVPSGAGKILSSATTSNGDVLMLTDKPTVYQLDTAAGDVSDVPVGGGGSWEKSVAIDTVQQNAFTLSPEKGQIWRYTRTLSSFNKPEPYLDEAQDLKTAVDLVTGAQVYVLKSDGTVLKFAGGKPAAFSLKAPPAPADKLTGANALGVHFSTNNVYVLDPKNRRVVEFAPNGDYSRQFRNDAFEGAQDIIVDDKTNTLYVLAGNKVYQVGLGG